ncbi:hypothetical protein [Methylovirgula sp. HY1]|uniref:hypothetical protein n=1 Tax=Methylovirgula sp. HY1 TaxID=2822761 RepID=UPI001C5B3513|nr:hypothetical protein [Methylovirgula sp. HY1]QXX74424.1 hypothetical protein MHY1_01236 [Methylovirgula sp. HY1]
MEIKTKDYSYAIADCDVIDKVSLATFREKRRTWNNWLKTDEHHAIQIVLSSMIWSDVSFRTISHMAMNNPKSALHNQLMTEALIHGHVSTQVLAIRRLMDKGTGVISLPRLLDDVKKNAKIITRENFVCFDGLPYDYEVAKQRVLSRMVGGWQPTSGPDAWWNSEVAHQEFDKLTGVEPENRERDDRIDKRIFDKLEDWLKESDSEELVNWSHAFLAHAAAPNSPNRSAEVPAPTLDRMTKATKHFVRVSEALGRITLSSGHGELVPVAQFDRFAHLENPMMDSNTAKDIADHWDMLAAEREKCVEGIEAELFAKIRNSPPGEITLF